MRLTLRVMLGMTLALLSLMPPSVRAAGQAPTPMPSAQLVAVEGASITYRLIDYDGRIVTVTVPSQSLVDVRRSNPGGTVDATLAAVNAATRRAQVVTQEGQTLVLDMSREALKGLQIGHTFTLVVPPRAGVMTRR